MKRWTRNVLAVIVGLVASYVVNMSIVTNSHRVVAPPAGADMMTAEGIRAAMPRMTAAHYAMPFLAHALGTFAGGLAAAATAASHKMRFAVLIGVVFLLLGIAMIAMVGGPWWFIALDLVVAFVPMAWLGGRLAVAVGRSQTPHPA